MNETSRIVTKDLVRDVLQQLRCHSVLYFTFTPLRDEFAHGSIIN